MEKKVQDLLVEQLDKELESSIIYLRASGYFSNANFQGFSGYFKEKSLEEYEHAMKVFDYLCLRKVPAMIGGIESQEKWQGTEALLRGIFEHEKKITRSIFAIKEQASLVKDYGVCEFLRWFVSEQEEEEAEAEALLNKFLFLMDDRNGMYTLDKNLKERITQGD